MARKHTSATPAGIPRSRASRTRRERKREAFFARVMEGVVKFMGPFVDEDLAPRGYPIFERLFGAPPC